MIKQQISIMKLHELETFLRDRGWKDDPHRWDYRWMYGVIKNRIAVNMPSGVISYTTGNGGVACVTDGDIVIVAMTAIRQYIIRYDTENDQWGLMGVPMYDSFDFHDAIMGLPESKQNRLVQLRETILNYTVPVIHWEES